MKRVLVTDADQRSALAITRSLGKKGVSVYTADDRPSALAGRSRYSRKYNSYPSPASDVESFTRAIVNICRENSIGMVIPVTEMTSAILLSRSEPMAGITLPLASLEAMNALSDKCSLMKTAQALEINTPATRFVEQDESFEGFSDLHAPIVLKPCKSWLHIDGKWNHTTVCIAESAPVAHQIVDSDIAFRSAPYMIQEYVPGYGAGVFAIYDQGSPLAFFAHLRLREKPPRGGISVLSESITVEPALKAITRKLLDHVGWHGVAMVEFRIADDGTPYLMEVNTRFWGSLQLAVDSGVDFPWMLYQLAVGDEVDPVASYRTGRRLRWLLGDLDRLYLVLRDPSFTIAEKARACRDFVTPAPFTTRHEVNRISDMGPFWYEIRQYLRDLVR